VRRTQLAKTTLHFKEVVMDQLLQLCGAILILGAYILMQLHKLTPESVRYLVPNVVGSGILAVLAYVEQQWGFLLLEGVWALVSAHSLVQALRSSQRT
jgi:hypothetical protein